jgi:hypothetical protein
VSCRIVLCRIQIRSYLAVFSFFFVLQPFLLPRCFMSPRVRSLLSCRGVSCRVVHAIPIPSLRRRVGKNLRPAIRTRTGFLSCCFPLLSFSFPIPSLL